MSDAQADDEEAEPYFNEAAWQVLCEFDRDPRNVALRSALKDMLRKRRDSKPFGPLTMTCMK